MIKCYDRVKVVTSVSWSFDPNHFFGYLYSGKTDTISKSKAMIPTLQQLINNAAWKTELCPLTQVEILNAD